MTELGKVIQASNIQRGESVKTESFNDVTELETLAGPIVEYLKTNYHPHAVVVITSNRVVVTETLLSVPTR